MTEVASPARHCQRQEHEARWPSLVQGVKGQRLTVVATSMTSSTTPTLSLLDPTGIPMTTSQSSAFGVWTLRPVRLVRSGTYTVRVTRRA